MAMTSLDRAAQRRTDPAALAFLLEAPEARILPFVGTRPVIRSSLDRSEARLAALPLSDMPGAPPAAAQLLFLGLHPATGAALFARTYEPEIVPELDPAGAVLSPAVDIRSLAMQGVLPPDELSIAATAAALVGWHETSRHCGRCGTLTIPRDGGWQRRCPACDLALFPRTDPVVIMLVTSGDHCVLARQAAFPPGMVSAIAGFIEPGETIEAAVARETREETGLAVGEVRYLASQPWPFPHSLMIGCFAAAEQAPLALDPTELEAARWVSRDEVRKMLANDHPTGDWVPGPHAIARWLIARFAEGSDLDQRLPGHAPA